MAKLYPLILPFQELYELVLFQLPASVRIDLIHQIFGLFFVDFQIAGFEHFYYLVF